MRCCRNWIGWWSLATGMLCVGAGTAAGQDPANGRPSVIKAAQRAPDTRLPFDEMVPALRKRIRLVVEHPVLAAQGPTEAFTGQVEFYRWLLDHPVQGMRAWRRLGAQCADLRDTGPGGFGWTDGHGSEIRWQTAFEGGGVRIWYAEGKVRPGLLMPPVPVQLVAVLRHGDRCEGNARGLIYHQADVFLASDSRTLALAMRMLGASAPRIAEQGLGQLELFFSGLVWYADQHPERMAKLLDENRAAEDRPTR
jgi:hypothetical protein